MPGFFLFKHEIKFSLARLFQWQEYMRENFFYHADLCFFESGFFFCAEGGNQEKNCRKTKKNAPQGGEKDAYSIALRDKSLTRTSGIIISGITEVSIPCLRTFTRGGGKKKFQKI